METGIEHSIHNSKAKLSLKDNKPSPNSKKYFSNIRNYLKPTQSSALNTSNKSSSPSFRNKFGSLTDNGKIKNFCSQRSKSKY